MRDKILRATANYIVSKPWLSLLWILIVTIILGGMAAQLELTMSFTNLMPQDDPMVIEFNTIMEEYDGASSLYVVAEGDEEALIDFAESIVPEIKILDQWVKEVVYKTSSDFFAAHGLMLMKSSDLENTRTLFEDPNLIGFLTNLNDSFEKEYIQSDEKISSREQEQNAVRFLDGIQTWVDEFDGVLAGEVEGAGKAATDAILIGNVYFQSWDRRTLILQILPTFSMLDIEPSIDCTNAVEEIVHRVAKEFGVRAGLSGSIPLTRDEMAALESDSMTITLLALVGILILFIVAFRMVVSPILAIVTLILGILWAMGLAWLLVGTLNLMTSMMAVVLVGLGIDFSIHIIAVFTEMRARGEDVLESMLATFQNSGAGIITGGASTAVAFLTMLVADTDGMREFGLVLGVGVIMTMFAALTVLPTLLILRERALTHLWKTRKQKAARDISYGFLGVFAQWLAKRWKFSMIAVLGVIGFLGYRGANITMDYNYLNMEPVGLESIELQDKMIEAFDISPDYALITARTLHEAQTLTEIAKDMSTAGMVQSIVDFLPPQDEQDKRRRLVKEIHDTMAKAKISRSFTANSLDRLREEIERLEANVMEIQSMAVLGGQDKVYLKSGLLVGVVPDEDDPSIVELNEELHPLMSDITHGTLTTIREKLESTISAEMNYLYQFHLDFAKAFQPAVLRMANSETITLEDIPPEIRNQYVGKSGDSFLISVFPKENVWEMKFLKRFSNELAEVSPRATGLPPVFNTLMDRIKVDGLLATQLAFVVIFLILLADFRSVRKAALAIIPLVIGVVLMLGTMELTGLQITLLNIMAIPMILGIGIDDGVHIIHRYQIEGGEAHRIVFASTGRAILLTSLTTMLGFGSLWFATYRGLGSMGIALFIGVGACFVATVLVIPTLVGFAHSFRK